MSELNFLFRSAPFGQLQSVQKYCSWHAVLVAELDMLDPEEIVDIAYSRNPFHAQYIRQKTGKLLTDFTIDVGSLPS